jgi:hypothetical protein
MGTERLASIQSKQMPPIFFKTIITGKAKLVAVSNFCSTIALYSFLVDYEVVPIKLYTNGWLLLVLT